MKEKREEGKVRKKVYEKPELTRCGKLTDVTNAGSLVVILRDECT